MQIQLDPNIPTNLSPEDMRDFKTFLDHALDALSAAAGGEIFTMGNAMLGFLAVIVVVLTGLKTAFSGNIQPWELVRVVIGIWIPWVMLQFYTTNIPGMIHTFPGMIAAGGNWLHELLIGDSLYAVQTELTNLFRALAKGQDAAAKEGDLLNIFTTGLHASMTAVAGFVMVIFMALMLLILAAVTYAQVIWAQVALAILIILGPVFIPFLVFDPLSFLFWGWFRAMITYSFYAVIAGAVLRVFSAVGIAYITSLANANLDIESFMDVGMWTLAVVPFFIAGMLASLKCGELASMLVTGGGAAGSGLDGNGERRREWPRPAAARRRRRRWAREGSNEEAANQRRRSRVRRDMGRSHPHQPSSTGDLRRAGYRGALAHRRRHSHCFGRAAASHRCEG